VSKIAKIKIDGDRQLVIIADEIEYPVRAIAVEKCQNE
jgi:hypothetical protein